MSDNPRAPASDPDFVNYLAICSQAFYDGRRNTIETALGVRERILLTKAIEEYTQTLITKRKRKGGENPSGRDSHSANTRLVLLKLARALGVEYLDELSSDQIQKYLDASTASSKTLRNHLSALGGLASWARRLKYIGNHPVQDMDRPPVPAQEIVVVPSRDIPDLLIGVQDTSVEVPVALALLAGLRRCEVLRLLPTDIDWGRSAIRIRPQVSKTGRARLVPMSPRLASIIKNRGAILGARVCLNKQGKPWNPAKLTRRTTHFLSNAGFKTIGFNELRHTFVTMQLDAGIPAWRVAGWSGHSVAIMEKHYGAHLHRPEDARIVDVAGQ